MAERLTEIGVFIDTPVYKIKNGKKGEAVDKLAKLEDILEKHGIESVEELEKEMHSLMLIISILNDYGIEDYNELDEILKEFSYMKKMETEIGKELKFYKTDRDTWKRACELACEKLADIYSHCEYELFGDSVDEYRKYCEENGNPLQNIRYCETKYFYQQAKKEKENE